MINVLIADDNINYAIALMNYINEQNRNIRVCNITKDGEETLNVLNSETDIDVILLDYKMPFYNGTQILENLQNKDKYKDSCIIISGEITPKSVASLRDNDLVHSIIFKSVSMSDINKRIKKLIEDKESSKNEENIRQKIISELIYLGYDISHKGHFNTHPTAVSKASLIILHETCHAYGGRDVYDDAHKSCIIYGWYDASTATGLDSAFNQVLVDKYNY